MSGRIEQMGRGQQQNNQQGFVSIIVTIIIIVFVTLVAVSFAFISRQNQTQSLNSQLSTQAFYAAESGVNQAIKKLKSANGLGDVTNCNNGLFDGADSTLNSDGTVKYTCVLVNNQPVDLRYDSISTDGSTIVHVRTNSPVNDLMISWQDTSGDKTSNLDTFADNSSNFYLPQKSFIKGISGGDSAYNARSAQFPLHTGILRATIIPTSAANSAGNLIANSQNIFLYPRGSASTNGLGSVAALGAGGKDGVFGDGNCNVDSLPDFCNVKITGINSTDFYLRLKAVYKNVAVTIRAFNGASPSASNVSGSVPLIGTQAVIDSTGKASDTVRRIQVRVPLQEGFIFPEYALESADTICKIWSVYPGNATYIAPPAALYPNAGGNNKVLDQAACQLPGMGPAF
jgi:Tfp pilus assembly protein PilX